MGIGFLTLHDFSVAIYETVVLKQESQTGYVGHLSGAIAGVLIGIFVLDNRRIEAWEGACKWICLLIFRLLLLLAILWNGLANFIVDDYFPPAKYKNLYPLSLPLKIPLL